MTAQSFDRLGMSDKSARMLNCGSFLAFKFAEDDSMVLHSANFCRIRLCPMCAWRRSLKIFSQVSRVMDEVTKEKDYEFLFLTLTIRNVSGEELPSAVTKILHGYRALFDRAVVKKNVLGAFRALEITHNTNRRSKSFDTYHPHLHCILMVNKSYFHKNYITQKKWAKLWGEAVGADYEPIVFIEKINSSASNIQKAVAETAKYTVKDNDFLSADSNLQDDAIRWLDKSLAGRRLISFRGEFDKIAKRLKLDDCIDGDLIHVDPTEELRDDLRSHLVVYRWRVGAFNYFKLDNDNDYIDNAPVGFETGKNS
jgi:plasmid rolling circle replication initiator protein Rep